MSVLIFVLSICFAMALGMPIAFALLFCGVALMWYLGIFDARLLAQQFIGGADNFPLMAIPFFLLVGQIMNEAGISKRIVNFAVALAGHVRGGLGYVAIIAAFIFGGVSGSAVADAAALCSIMVPMMAYKGYDRGYSAALIGSAGIIALIIPPSMTFIVFGAVSGVSIMKLFIAGIAPAVVIALGLVVAWYFLSRKMNLEVYPRKSFKELLQATREAFWALILPILILIGLRFGVVTPTEAAVGALAYTIFLNFAIYREVNFRDFCKLLVKGAKVSSIIVFLIASAMISSWMIAVANIPETITSWLQPFLSSKLLLLLVINLIVFIIGTAMDATPTILILTPVLMPVINAAGIDPVYFGVIFVLNNAIGLLTPPVGTVLNAACGSSNVTMDEMLVKVLPFLAMETAVLILLILVPELTIIPYQLLVGK
ncbi:MAG: TRAP transporter large permease [Desulfotomaculales bacterium]